ncbi:hypothetical protein V7S43_018135 [Phytophthora oleae]|uniref:Leucine-rich repeat-containing N-terminal plant-type domain-containing protein n=1 Tax=Phytophthora oleae TaxID=2107226 RepID=A0ABD3ES33_9STRA
MFRVAPGSSTSPQARDIRHCKPSDRHYALLWTFMLLLHAISAAFLLSCAKLYWFMENGYLDYFVTLLAPERDRHFRVVGTGLGVLGAAHALQLLSHLGASVIARKLTVRTVKFGSDSMSFVTIIVKGLVRILIFAIQRWKASNKKHRKITTKAANIHRNDDESYGRMFAIRKTVEIATQVPNAYLYSTLIARSWINHAKVALLVANCWSALIIHRMLMKNERDNRSILPSISQSSRTSIRVLAIVVDALLGIATGVLLPIAIFMPYLLQFDFESLDFPDTLLYGDTAFPNLVLENRAFFAISWANAVMKGVPHVGVFLCLIALASMLDTTTKSGLKPSPPRLQPRIGPNTKRSSVATASYRALMRATNTIQGSRHQVNRLLAPVIFLVTGGVVLALHLTARYSHVEGDMDLMERTCLQRMHPWLAQNFSCAVVKYNCYQESVVSPPLEALGWLERDAMRTVIFLHCSAFVMPPILREFPVLMGAELWNITLVRWGEEAALSANLHPMMLFLIFTYVNMAALPAGILQSPLPEQLTDLEFCHTNLTTLPDGIVEVWSNVGLIYIEHSQLDPFPAILTQLPSLSELSLIDNKFETIPEQFFQTVSSTYFYDLALSRNPLKSLPEARTEAFDVSYLSLEFTQLTELPAWVNSKVWESVSLGGSPICGDNSAKLPDLAICGQDGQARDPLGEERHPTQLIALSRTLQ